MHDLRARKSTFEKIVPINTAHSTSRKRKTAETPLSWFQFMGSGKINMIWVIYMMRLTMSNMPAKEQNYLAPSMLSLGLLVMKLKIIITKWVTGIQNSRVKLKFFI